MSVEARRFLLLLFVTAVDLVDDDNEDEIVAVFGDDVDEYFLRSNWMPLLARFKLGFCFVVGFLKNSNRWNADAALDVADVVLELLLLSLGFFTIKSLS